MNNIVALLKKLSLEGDVILKEYEMSKEDKKRIESFRKSLKMLTPHALKPGRVDVMHEIAKEYSKMFRGRGVDELLSWELQLLNAFIPIQELEEES